MIKVYVAGPYNAGNICSCLDNMRRGMQASIDVLKAGYAPFCPWLDHHYGLMDGAVTREMYQAQSMAWLEVSDAVLVLDGWETSSGTKAEIARAKEVGIPVFYTLDYLMTAMERTK